MTKKITQLLLLFILTCQSVDAQGFLTVEHLEHFTPAQLFAKFLFITTFDYGADVYKVTYESTDLEGNSTIVSGMLAVPDDPTNIYPFACYQHGTAGFDQDVPSALGLDSDIPIALAGKGYVTVAPDLLGLGVHAGVHPYVHAESAVWVSVDMMRAGREYALANDIFMNDQVFVTGYSQGGHSAMALHQHLEQELDDEFHVTAAAPMSGPYSMAEVMRDLILSEEEYGRPGYLIITFISYQEVYGNIYTDIESTFRAPYRQLIEDYSNDEISLSALDTELVSLLESIEGSVIPLRILEESFVEAVVSDPSHPMNLAMEENNVYDWAPDAPTRLYYCEMDEEVPFENSIVAEAAMQANGATDVLAISASATLDHFLCAFAASLETVDFFGEYQIIEDAPVGTAEELSSQFSVFPNPTNGPLIIDNITEDGKLTIHNAHGKIVMTQNLSTGRNQFDLNGLLDGVYFLEIIVGNKLVVMKVFKD